MKNNPHQNLGIEKNTPANEVAGVLQAYLFATHQAVAGTSRVLFQVVEQEMRRQAAQEYVSKPANPAPEVAAPVAAPSSSNVLGQAALREQQSAVVSTEANLLAEPANPDDLEAQQLNAIAKIHAEIEAERLNQGDFGRAA